MSLRYRLHYLGSIVRDSYFQPGTIDTILREISNDSNIAMDLAKKALKEYKNQ